MGIFRLGKKNKTKPGAGIIGIDLAATGIKMVEISQENGGFALKHYAFATLDKTILTPINLRENLALAAELIKTGIEQGGFSGLRVVASLPSSHVFQGVITIQAQDKTEAELKPLIENQMAKLLPFPVSEAVLDSRIIPQENKEYFKIQLNAAPKTLIESYVRLFAGLGVELLSLETETFALIRSLVGTDQGAILLVDIGEQRSSLVIVKAGIPLITRGIKIGGREITQTIMDSLGLGFKEAELMKRDFSYNQTKDLPPAIKTALAPVLHEIRYIINLATQAMIEDLGSIDKILLTGGSSRMNGLAEYLQAEIGLNIYLGDPWNRLQVPRDGGLVLDEVGPKLAVAIGLALRGEEL